MQPGTSDFDVAIVGLGPVGAVAANLAGAAGLRTLVLERGDVPYLKPRAIVFDAEIMRIFDSVGLASIVSGASRSLEGSIYLGADRRPIRTFRARARSHRLFWHPSNLFYQPQLEEILREGLTRFPNVTVLRKHDVTRVQQTDDHCTIGAGALSARAKCVLACDGASSTLRKSLDIPLEDIGFEERWLVLDARVKGPMRWPSTHEIPEDVRSGRYSLMVCDPARPSTLIPGVGNHRRWEYMLLPGERDEEVVTTDWLHKQLSLWIDPSDVEIIRSAVYRFRALIARRWRAHRIFLLGDAAHQTPPFYGQGMCHGIRDAAQLMWKLHLALRGVIPFDALESYQIEREPHVREIIAASVAAGAQVCKLDPEAAAARDAEFRRIEAERANAPVAMTDVVPPMRAGIIDTATGGMRLPEFVCVTADGVLHRMDELLAGRFTLLHLNSDIEEPLTAEQNARWRQMGGQDLGLGSADSSGAAVRDYDNSLASWFSRQRARWAIVRPDRYVYAMAADRQTLHTQMEHLFVQLNVRGRRSSDRHPEEPSASPAQGRPS